MSSMSQHRDKLLKTLYTLYQNQRYCDLTIKVQDGEVRVHSLILCASSEFFKKLISAEDQLRVICLFDMTLSDIEMVIKFVYTGDVSFDHGTMESNSKMNLLQKLGLVEIGMSDKETDSFSTNVSSEEIKKEDVVRTDNTLPLKNISPSIPKELADHSQMYRSKTPDEFIVSGSCAESPDSQSNRTCGTEHIGQTISTDSEKQKGDESIVDIVQEAYMTAMDMELTDTDGAGSADNPEAKNSNCPSVGLRSSRAKSRSSDAHTRFSGASMGLSDVDVRSPCAKIRSAGAETKSSGADMRSSEAEIKVSVAEIRAPDAKITGRYTGAVAADTRSSGIDFISFDTDISFGADNTGGMETKGKDKVFSDTVSANMTVIGHNKVATKTVTSTLGSSCAQRTSGETEDTLMPTDACEKKMADNDTDDEHSPLEPNDDDQDISDGESLSENMARKVLKNKRPGPGIARGLRFKSGRKQRKNYTEIDSVENSQTPSDTKDKRLKLKRAKCSRLKNKRAADDTGALEGLGNSSNDKSKEQVKDVIKSVKRKRGMGRVKHLCPECGRVFRTLKLLTGHRHAKHSVALDSTQFEIFKCKECDYETLETRRLECHYVTAHSTVRPYMCEWCGKNFKLLGALTLHTNTHTKARKFDCPHCDKTFTQTATRQRHIDEKHKNSLRNLCDECPFSTVDRVKLVQHKYNHHSTPLPPGYTIYRCTIEDCNFETFRKQKYADHIKGHKGVHEYTCEECNKMFTSIAGLRSHKNIHREKSVQCTYPGCNFSTRLNNRLVQHVRHMHTHRDVKPHACPHCPYKTAIKGNLDKHQQNVHTASQDPSKKKRKRNYDPDKSTPDGTKGDNSSPRKRSRKNPKHAALITVCEDNLTVEPSKGGNSVPSSFVGVDSTKFVTIDSSMLATLREDNSTVTYISGDNSVLGSVRGDNSTVEITRGDNSVLGSMIGDRIIIQSPYENSSVLKSLFYLSNSVQLADGSQQYLPVSQEIVVSDVSPTVILDRITKQ